MKNKYSTPQLTLVCAGAALLLLSACCKNPPQQLQNPASTSAPAIAGGPVAPAGQQATVTAASTPLSDDSNPQFRVDSQSTADGTLTTRVTAAKCESGKGASGTADVTWEVTKPGVNSVKVFAKSQGATEKLWVEGGAKGHDVTGPWIGDGTVLRLADAANLDGTIAQSTFTAKPCQ